MFVVDHHHCTGGDSPKKDRKNTFKPFRVNTNQTLVKGKVSKHRFVHNSLSQRRLVRKKRWKWRSESLVTCVPRHLQEIKVPTQVGSQRGQNIHICAQCNKSFWRADELKSHQLIHTGENCRGAGSADIRPIMFLRKYILKHTGQQPQQCNQCEYSAIQVV